MGRWVPMSTSTVPYTRPRRNAKSSTPSTSTPVTLGSGSALTRRSSVDRPTATPSLPAMRAPARPANATPIASSTPRSNTVRRA
jgi:hypothetical protein